MFRTIVLPSIYDPECVNVLSLLAFFNNFSMPDKIGKITIS